MPLIPRSNRAIVSRALAARKGITRGPGGNPRIVASGGGGGAPSISATAWKAVTNTAANPVIVAPATGSTLVTVIWSYDATSTPVTCTDNLGGTWTKQLDIPASSSGAVGSVWTRFAIPAGITSVITAGSVSTLAMTTIVHQLSNVTAITGGETGASNYTIAINPTTATITNATANSIFMAFLANDVPTGTATYTLNFTGTNPTGWALADNTNSQETNASSNVVCSTPYKIVTTSAASKHIWTTDTVAGTVGIICFH